MVSQLCLVCGSMLKCQTLCLGARPRYSLVLVLVVVVVVVVVVVLLLLLLLLLPLPFLLLPLPFLLLLLFFLSHFGVNTSFISIKKNNNLYYIPFKPNFKMSLIYRDNKFVTYLALHSTGTVTNLLPTLHKRRMALIYIKIKMAHLTGAFFYFLVIVFFFSANCLVV